MSQIYRRVMGKIWFVEAQNDDDEIKIFTAVVDGGSHGFIPTDLSLESEQAYIIQEITIW